MKYKIPDDTRPGVADLARVRRSTHQPAALAAGCRLAALVHFHALKNFQMGDAVRAFRASAGIALEDAAQIFEWLADGQR